MFIIKYIIRFLIVILYRLFFRPVIRRQEKRRDNKNVLVQINSGLGDAIRALPMVHALKMKGYQVYLIANPLTKEIADLCPDIKDSYIVKFTFKSFFDDLKTISRLKQYKFRFFFGALPSNVIRYTFLPIILGIPFRTKHRSLKKKTYRNYDFLFNFLVNFNPKINTTESNFQLLSGLDIGFDLKQINHNVVLLAEVLKAVITKVKTMGYSKNQFTIGIHPGCNDTWAFKRWPFEKFARLIDLLAEKKDIQIILFGGSNEIKLAKQIVEDLKNPLINCVGIFSIKETLGAISLCNLFISNDSGLMHMASIFKIPIIGLFGGRSNELASGPYSENHMILKKNNVENIKVSDVFHAAQIQIEKNKRIIKSSSDLGRIKLEKM